MFRHFQILFCIALLFVCSMLNGMANTGHSEEVRAEVFESNAVEDKQEKQAAQLIDDFGLLPELLSAEQSEFSSNGEEEETSNQAKRLSKLGISSKCRLHNSLSAGKASKGVASHPATQDPLQQRTAAIHFLQEAALV